MKIPEPEEKIKSTGRLETLIQSVAPVILGGMFCGAIVYGTSGSSRSALLAGLSFIGGICLGTYLKSYNSNGQDDNNQRS